MAPCVLATTFVAALALAGCAASTFDVLPEKFGGLPEGAPARPAEVGAYPNVYEPMVPREIKKLNEGEQKSAEQELLALRATQNLRVNPPAPGPSVKKAAAAPQQKKQQQQQKQQPAKKAPDLKAAEKKAPDKQAN